MGVLKVSIFHGANNLNFTVPKMSRMHRGTFHETPRRLATVGEVRGGVDKDGGGVRGKRWTGEKEKVNLNSTIPRTPSHARPAFLPAFPTSPAKRRNGGDVLKMPTGIL